MPQTIPATRRHRPDRRRHHERDTWHDAQGTRPVAQHRHARNAGRLCAGKLAGVEQRRHRPCRELRAELYAAASRWQRRHLPGAGGQHRVRPVAPALVVSRQEGGDRRSARLHPPVPAHELRLGQGECRIPARALQGDVGAPLLSRHGVQRGPQADRRLGTADHRRARCEPADRGDAHRHRGRRRLRFADASAGGAARRLRPASRCTTNSALSGWSARRTAVGAWRSRMSSSAKPTRSPRNSSSSAPAAARCHCCRSRASPKGTATAAFRSAASGCAATSPAVSDRHHAKVYGKAAEGSPPMSVPHLDTRIIGGNKSLLFGPYAGFSTQVPQARLAHRSVPLDRTWQHSAACWPSRATMSRCPST